MNVVLRRPVAHALKELTRTRGFVTDPETPGGMMSEEALKEKKDVFHGRTSIDIRGSRRSLASAALSPRRGSKTLEMSPISERSLRDTFSTAPAVRPVVRRAPL